MGQDMSEVLKRIKFGTFKKTRAYLNFHRMIIAYTHIPRNCNHVSDIRWTDSPVDPVQY